MISSKKFDLIAILLAALVLVGVVFAMFLPNTVLTGNSTGVFAYSDLHSVTITDDDYYSTYTDAFVSKISLKGTSAETNSHNVEIDGSDVTILGGGVYVIAGTLDDGSIVVDSADGAEVTDSVLQSGIVSEALATRLNELEEEKAKLEAELALSDMATEYYSIDADTLLSEYDALKKTPSSPAYKELIRSLIKKIEVGKYSISITLKTGLGLYPSLDTTYTVSRKELYETGKKR